jgi:hypothetical protein
MKSGRFVMQNKKNVPNEHKNHFGYGDFWTFSAICADTKLVPSWLVGLRDADTAFIFLEDLYARLKNQAQLHTEGH